MTPQTLGKVRLGAMIFTSTAAPLAAQCGPGGCGQVELTRAGANSVATQGTGGTSPEVLVNGAALIDTEPSSDHYRVDSQADTYIQLPKGQPFHMRVNPVAGWSTEAGDDTFYIELGCGVTAVTIGGIEFKSSPENFDEFFQGHLMEHEFGDGTSVTYSSGGCGCRLLFSKADLWDVGMSLTMEIPGDESCDAPGKPTMKSGSEGFRTSIASGSDGDGVSAGVIQWNGTAPSMAVDPGSWDFAGADLGLNGVTDVTFGSTRQIKTATMLTEMTRASDVLTVRKFGVAGIGAPDSNGLYSTAGLDLQEEGTYEMSETTDPMTSEILTSHLQVSVTRGTETVVWHELDYDAATGRRESTDHLAGTRGAEIAGETGTGQRTETREEFRYSPTEEDFVLISRVRDVFDDFVLLSGTVERMVETIVDPGGADLATSFGYDPDTGERTATRYPDGSWASRTAWGIAADGSPDTNAFPDITGDIVSINYRPWLDASLPSSGVPDADVCVAELEIDMVSFVRRETRALGEVTSRVDTWTGDFPAGPDPDFRIEFTRTWNSDDADDHLTREVWTHKKGEFINRTYMTIAEDGTEHLFDYARGTYASNVFTAPTGNFLRTREWNAAQVTGGSTRTVRIQGEDGRMAEELLEVWDGTDWATMSTDHWVYDDEHAEGKETKHFKGGILVSRSTETATTRVTQSASGPIVRTLLDAEGNNLSVIEDYPAPMADITTTYSRDGRKEFSSRTAGGLAQSTVAESDLAGRIFSTTDERGITTLTGYSADSRTLTTTRPGGVTMVSTRYADGQQKSLSGTGVIPAFWAHAVDNDGLVSTTQYTGSTDDSSPRWQMSVVAWNGRPHSTIQPSPTLTGNVVETRHYDDVSGRLEKISSTGMADRLFTYDFVGRLTLSGLDLDSNGELTLASTDRVNQTLHAYVESGGQWWDQFTSAIYHTDNNGTNAYTSVQSTTVSPVEEDGAARWTTVSIRPGGLTVTTHRDEFFSTATVVETADSSATSESPDSTAESIAGRLMSYSEFGAAQSTTFGHDAFGRQNLVKDPRGGNNRTIYNAAGQVTQQIDHARNTTVIDYYPVNHPSAGLQKRVSNPELESTEYTYNSRGQVTEVAGSGTYPLSYGYDTYGDFHTLTTYASGGAGDTTTWVREPATGVVLEKTYADQNGPTYTYHPTGEVHTRTWARLDGNDDPLVTTYNFNSARDLTDIDYSDATPDVILVPDRLGRPAEITDGGGTLVRTYHNELPVPANDEYAATHAWLPGVTVEHAWTAATAQWLHTGAKRGETWDLKSNYLHDPTTGRLEMITGPGFAHRYEYAPGTSLITGINHRDTEDEVTLAREIRRTDLAGRLFGIETRGENDAVLQRHGYRHDKTGRRVRATREDGSYWAYGYNDRGEVISGTKHLPDGTALAGQQFGYDYDTLGNRNWAKSGGDANGENLRTVSYEANALNQYTEIVSPGGLDVIGRAPANDTVTVNSQATLRQGDRFHAEVTADNSASAVWQDITVSDGTPPGIEGSRYVPKATVTPDHDQDGNLLFDGRWDYEWDAENRLVSMTTNATAQATGEPYRKLVFNYDWMGKRIRKQVFDSPTATTPLEDLRFAYDGWNLIAEYSASSGLLTCLRGYTWGTDLSGTAQGAGGVGGLLSVRQGGASYAASYDGNGNIVGWVNAVRELASNQEFDPFGNRIIHENSVDIPFGFSTKYQDKETGLLYYGYRFYDSVTGRWQSRDPIKETGGVNLYKFTRNNPIRSIDILGLSEKLSSNVRRNLLFIAGPESAKPEEADYNRIRTDDPGLETNGSDLPYYYNPGGQNNFYQKISGHNAPKLSKY